LEYPKDYASERALTKLIPAFALLKRLGVSAADVSGWIEPTVLLQQANSIKQSLKAKYSSDQWLQIAKQLRDPLREQQRDALVEYLLVNPPAGVYWSNANEIYSHFLIDVEMSAVQGTSRIVQAISSIQLFVLRCFLNLEAKVTINAVTDSDADSSVDDGVDDGADDKWLQWQWMSRYRLWEANRKVFLYPENWIEPSLRRDKSPFMMDLENDLLQKEVTNDAAEDAFLSYLEKLDAVARLQVVGLYYDYGKVDISHLAVPGDLTILPPSVNLDQGDFCKFIAYLDGSEKTATWKVDNGLIDSGKFTAPMKACRCKVTATIVTIGGQTKSATSDVTVREVSIALDPSTPPTLTLNPGDSPPTFKAIVSGTTYKAVTWETTTGGGTFDGAIKTSKNPVTYTAPSVAGSYTITVKSVADLNKITNIIVTVNSISVKIQPTSSEAVPFNGKRQLAATVIGASETEIKWTVTAEFPSVAAGKITLGGLYTAPSKGAVDSYGVTVIATVDGVSDSVDLTVGTPS
jgi:hypothetical protein